MFGEDVIRKVRDSIDVVSLIGEYVALKRSGASFKGLCPFHSEKSPSFYVHPARQFFHCFGCQASGDVISFIQRLEGLSFVEAVRRLAERGGVELPTTDAREDAAIRQASAKRARLVAITEAAAGYYLKMLAEHPLGSMARHELEKRNVTPDSAATYRLGYAPNGWDGLARFLAQKGFSPAEAEEVGLIVPRKSGDGHYDRFRHRLMFPIADLQGHIVAFSGRSLDTPPGEQPPDEAPAKYINSPESPLYKKGELLFGAHEARVELRREGEALLAEGNFDVVALHQAGFKNVVAPLGTAFTPMQAKVLKRFVAKVTLVFDGDRAGKKAVANAYPLLAEVGLPTKVVTLPGGDDPDSFLRKRGADAFKALHSAAPSIVDHLIEAAAAEAGRDPAARAVGIESLGPVLARIESPVERGLYVERVAQAFQVPDLGAVRRSLNHGVRGTSGPRRSGLEPKASETAAARPVAVFLPDIECAAVGVLLDQPKLLGSDGGETIAELLSTSELRAVVHAVARMIEEMGAIDGPTLLTEVPEGARGWLAGRLAKQEVEAVQAEAYLASCLSTLRGQANKRMRDDLERRAREAARGGDIDTLTRLTRELQDLAKRARP